MGNGVSTDHGGIPAHGKRDVKETVDTRQYNWSELAEAPITNSLLMTANSYIGASNAGPSSSSLRFASSTEDDTRLDVHSDDQPRGRQSLNSADDDTQQTKQRSSVMKDDNEHGNAHNGAQQLSRPAGDDQRRERKKKKKVIIKFNKRSTRHPQ